jgi:hypothetical protein
MSTYTIHPRERSHHSATAWTLQHPAIATVAALAAAVLAGVLIGVLFNIVFSGTEAAPLHRAGGHAMAATINVAQPATAASESGNAGRRQRDHRHPSRRARAGTRRLLRPLTGRRPRTGRSSHEVRLDGKLSPQEMRRPLAPRRPFREAGCVCRAPGLSTSAISPPASAGTRTRPPARLRARRGRRRSRAGTRAPRRRPRPA